MHIRAEAKGSVGFVIFEEESSQETLDLQHHGFPKQYRASEIQIGSILKELSSPHPGPFYPRERPKFEKIRIGRFAPNPKVALERPTKSIKPTQLVF